MGRGGGAKPPRTRGTARLMAGSGFSLTAALAVTASPAAAQSVLTVDNAGVNAGQSACTAANNDCSLPGALSTSNSSDPNVETILFSSSLSGQTIALFQPQYITDAVTIGGPGSATVTVSGSDTVRPFEINAGSDQVTFSGFTIRDGFTGLDGGAAIYDVSSKLKLSNMTLADNTAYGISDDGGALLVGATGYDNGGQTIVENSTFSGNSAFDDGGAIAGENRMGSIRNSTFTGNTANDDGGAILINDSVDVIDSTITGNTAGDGGGITDSGPTYSLVKNTIVANNVDSAGAQSRPDVFGMLTPVHSLIEDIAGGTFLNATAVIAGADPQLGPLQANGGATATMMPSLTSPALDRGDSDETLDQRGLVRTVDLPSLANAMGGDGSDIGAVELTQAEATPPVTTPPTTTPATPTKPKCKSKKRKKCKKKRKKKK